MSDTTLRVIYLVMILVAIGGWGLAEYRSRLGEAARSLLAWALIVMGLMAGYGLYKDNARALRPAMTISGHQVEIPRAEDGHYHIEMQINGQKMIFLADTGATSIVLSPSDARSLGIDPATLSYLGSANTANGIVRTARITLPLVELGPFKDQNLQAFVNEAEMDGSLMGMDYLGRFDIKIASDTMILQR
jgi:aspartyl protease family protein